MAYTVINNSSYRDESVPEPSDPAPREGAAASANIRRRTIQVMAAEFVLLMGVAAIQGFWPGAGGGHGLALVFLALCALTVPYVMARLTTPDPARPAADGR